MISILVVDDEAPIRDWVSYCIESQNNPDFQVVAKARNGIEGLQMAQTHHPDLVITDIMMSGLDGLEMMKAILKELPYTNFILLSNHAEFSYAQTALSYGAKHYLLKSELRSSDLIEAISAIHQTKLELLQGKVTDIYANGFLDIYDVYQHTDDSQFVRDFFSRHGMQDNKPYCILGLQETNLFSQKQLLDTLLVTERPEVFLSALQKQTILVILQESNNNTLISKAQSLAEQIQQYSSTQVALGHSQISLGNILEALHEIEQLVKASFFFPDKPILKSSFFFSFPPLDRQQLWKTSTEILESLQLQDSKKAQALALPWLERLQRVGLEDILWAKETSLRMVFSLEERLLHTQGKSGSSDEQPLSFPECKSRIELAFANLEEQLSDAYTQRIHKALEYIHSQYANQISLVEVADHVGLSAEYFSRLFKEKTGENFSVYLMMFRLQQAHRLLKETNDKIYDIANQVGYASPSYFTKIFKKYMLMNPEDVRKKQEMSR